MTEPVKTPGQTVLFARRVRLCPDDGTIARLTQMGHGVRRIYNLVLNDVDRRYRGWLDATTFEAYPGEKPQINQYTCIALATAFAKAEPYLSVLHSQVVQQAGLRVSEAFAAFWAKRAKHPRFHRKSPVLSIPYPQMKPTDITATHIRIPGVGRVACVMSYPITDLVGPGRTPKSMTISTDGRHWYASIMVERAYVPMVRTDTDVVGIDRGVTVSAMVSYGARLELPQPTLSHQRRRRIRARRVSRRHKHSNRRAAAQRRLNTMNSQEVRRRRDQLHNFTTHIAKTKRHIVVEDLLIPNLVRSAAGTVDQPGRNVAAKSGLNRRIQASLWGELVRQLRYKCLWYGSDIYQVPAAYSSQTCAVCGHVADGNRHGIHFQCLSCGHTAHADQNAAAILVQRWQRNETTRITNVPTEGRKRSWRKRRGNAHGSAAHAAGDPGADAVATAAVKATPGACEDPASS